MMTITEITTIILIALGAGVMAFATIRTRQILQLGLEDKDAHDWKILFYLMVFFLAGYLATIVLVLLGLSNILVIATGVIFFFGALFVFLASQVSSSTVKDLLSTTKNLLTTTDKLQVEHVEVGRRSQELERRISQLRTAAEISRTISTFLEPQDIFQQVVELIRERYNLYYVGVFLIDEQQRHANLKAGTGEPGRKMIAENYKLTIGDSSMIGWTIAHRQARITLDVTQDTIRYTNPLLPLTRSELALPIVSGNHILGALTIQSEQRAAFDQDDITILQSIADTLATSIENTRLFREIQESLRQVEMLHGNYSEKSWSKLGRAVGFTGYQYDDGEINPVQDTLGHSAVKPETTSSPLVIPLKIRGQVIANIKFWPDSEKWSDENRTLLEAIADRVGQALESARLFEEAQARASREQQINVITTQIRKSAKIESILQSTVRELGRALGASRTFIQLGTTSESEEKLL